jgi:alpha-N-arabinofuranosidase
MERPLFLSDLPTAHEPGRDAPLRVRADPQVGPTRFMESPQSGKIGSEWGPQTTENKDTMKLFHPLLSCAAVSAVLGIVATMDLKAQETNAPAEPAVMTVGVDVSQTRDPISPYLYGQFTEHLGRCIYGGIWAEMLEDRKFYFPVPAQTNIWRFTRNQARVLAGSPWKVIGPQDDVRMVEKDAFVGKHSPQIPAPGNGMTVGIYQEELGVLKGKKYTGYVLLSGDAGVAPVTISLSWGQGESDKELHTIRKVRSTFTRVPFTFTARGDSDNACLAISTSGKGILKIGCVSLMPADNEDGFRKDTLDLLRQLDAPVYRWPGGNFVSGYDWRDGLGPRDTRPPRTNPAWTGIEPNDVGMHEFMRFCERVGAESMVSVNTGFGDAYTAAAEVEYANGGAETPMGRLRASNGHPGPFGVKWWCVGNEMFGRWQLGYMQLNQYVLKHNWVEEKMRRVDPTIKTIACGQVGLWSQGMLSNCADHMNLISEHFYVRHPNDDVVLHVQAIPENIKRIADAHRQYRNEIPALKGRDIRVSVDEWNYWYGPEVFGELGTRYFLKDALGIAAGLHEYFRDTDIIFMANYAQTVNVIGCVKTTKTHAEFDSTAMPLLLYRHHFGTIPVRVEPPPGPCDFSAALTADRKALTVAVVNPTAAEVPLKLNLNAAVLAGNAQTWIITGPDPLAYNQPGEPRKVDIAKAAPADLGGVVMAKPMSVTLWRAPIR